MSDRRPMQELADAGQSVWLDYIRRDLMETGELDAMIDDGLRKLDQTTLGEILRVVPIEMVKEFSQRSALHAASVGGDFAAPDAALLITDPEDDWPLIDKLFETYSRLCKTAGQPLSKGDSML